MTIAATVEGRDMLIIVTISREAAAACSRGCEPTEWDTQPNPSKPRSGDSNQLLSPSNKYRRNPVALQKLDVLLFKRFDSMVLLLILNVFANRFNLVFRR